MVKTFGNFEFDDQRRTLRARGRAVKLSGQALDLLCVLLERPGELISREEIQRRLWPDTNVAFGHSLDVVVSRLRSVLGDTDPCSRHIETVPRKGYRFIGPVLESTITVRPARKWPRRLLQYGTVALAAFVLAVLVARTRYQRFVPVHRSDVNQTAPSK